MSSLPNYKDIVDLIKKGATLEAQEKIMELREACMALEEDNYNQKKRIRELEDVVRFKEALTYVAPFYYLGGDQHPFCPRCWEKDRAGIHLGPEIQDNYIYVRPCPQCKATYKTRDVEFRIG